MRVSLLYGWSVCSVCARFHLPRIKFDGALLLTGTIRCCKHFNSLLNLLQISTDLDPI